MQSKGLLRPLSRRDVVLMWVVLLGIAAFFRATWLDLHAFRADTIHFWSMAEQGLSPGRVWSRWMDLMGWSAQFPLAAAAAMIPTGWFGLPLSPFSVRIMDALFGIVSVGAAWLAARELAGKPFALAAALFVALNPLHIQLSREAYFYSSLVAGAFLLLAATIHFLRFPARRTSKRWIAIWMLGMFLSAYSHFTGWILAGLSGLIVLVKGALACRRGGRGKSVFEIGAAALLVALPLLWLPWAIPYSIKKMSDAQSKADAVRVMGEVKTPIGEMLAGYGGTMMWGTTGWAWVVLAVACAGVVAYLVVGGRRRTLAWLVGLFAGCTAGYLVVMKSQNMYEAVRHVCFVFPLWLVMVLYGLWSLPRLRGIRTALGQRRRGVATLVVLGAALAVQIPASWAALRLTGSPTPYRDIQAWCNSHQDQGSPILVDRWFEPWNELRVYPSTNLVYMFTQPNEPLDVFIQGKWRDGAREFLENNPDAAYMEIAKSYATEPGVGPWTWPREYFAHQTSIVNRAGLVLRERGQAFRQEDFRAADTNRVVVEIFYNEKSDVVQKAKAMGRSIVVWPGYGWTFMKSGPVQFLPLQTQAFMDWRRMDQAASLQLVNTGDQAQRVRLVIRALAVNRPKPVSAGAAGSFVFSPGQLQEWRTDEVTVQPGETTLILQDRSGEPAPLLVNRWNVEIVEASP